MYVDIENKDKDRLKEKNIILTNRNGQTENFHTENKNCSQLYLMHDSQNYCRIFPNML